MVRIHFNLPEEQVKWLKECSVQFDTPMSEILRRVIDRHISDIQPKSAQSLSKKKEQK